ncbi:AAA+-type ATPase [Balamuthia mandrillaris]
MQEQGSTLQPMQHPNANGNASSKKKKKKKKTSAAASGGAANTPPKNKASQPTAKKRAQPQPLPRASPSPSASPLRSASSSSPHPKNSLLSPLPKLFRLLPYTEKEALDEKEKRRSLVYLHLSTMQRLSLVIGEPLLLLPLPSTSRGSGAAAAAAVVGTAWPGGQDLREGEARVSAAMMRDICCRRCGSGEEGAEEDEEEKLVRLRPLHSSGSVRKKKEEQEEKEGGKDRAEKEEEKEEEEEECPFVVVDVRQVTVALMDNKKKDRKKKQKGPEEVGGRGAVLIDDIMKIWVEQALQDRYWIEGNTFSLSIYGQQRLFQITNLQPSFPSASTSSASCLLVGRITSSTTVQHVVKERGNRREEEGEKQETQATETEEHPRIIANMEDDQKEKVKEEEQTKHTNERKISTLSYESIGGLRKEVERVKELVELALHSPQLFTDFGLRPPKGILLYGPPGTGKTLIARVVAKQCSASIYIINGPEIISKYYGESEAKLRKVFQEAALHSPALVFIDEVDAIAAKRDDGSNEMENRVVATLLTLMDGIITSTNQVIVIAATNRPNALDPALRRAGRFDNEIEIGIPTEEGRREILEVVLASMPHSLLPEDVAAIAAITHGFVGADLTALCREAALNALNKLSSLTEESIAASLEALTISLTDIKEALKVVRPSAMREVVVDVPKVNWIDIGGQEDTKQKLKEAVEWPLKHPEAFQRMGIRPPKGILLYGPPGCSKTLMAKALATESGCNFIAIKGPELFSKWVGESERAVREVFRKARAASPSIVFFDEIDAIATHRGAGDEGTSSVTDRVLSQLLNEMNGIEPLTNVTIVAATNRPDMIDKALLRPGRIDRMLYVSPPDLASRRTIFKIQMKKIPTLAHDIDAEALAVATEGYSGAEIVGVCREACLSAMREDVKAEVVLQRHFLSAIRNVQPRITPQMVQFYKDFAKSSIIESI